MTRFGVMKHLRVLEDAGLVVTRRSGREKLHFLNPVPIRLIHDRWIDKYSERQISALADLKRQSGDESMTTMTASDRPSRSTACTSRQHPRRSGTRSPSRTGPNATATAAGPTTTCARAGPIRGLASEAMRAHGAPEVAVDGEVIEADPPRKLVQTWRMAMVPDLAAEGFTRITYEIEPAAGDTTKLTLTHDLTGAPGLAALVAGDQEHTGAGGGWAWVLSGLKTVLETGAPLGR